MYNKNSEKIKKELTKMSEQVIITFYGHSCVGIDFNNYSILIDPFIIGNSLAKLPPDDLHPNLILVTHAHKDHFGDTIQIAINNKSLVLSSPEIADYCTARNVQETRGIHIDEIFKPQNTNITIKVIKAVHNSIFADGTYGGNACGYYVTAPNLSLYHAGDTSYFDEMQNLANKVEIAFFPIGDPYIMNFDEIISAVKAIKPKIVVPVHYNTTPELTQNPDEFANFLQSQTGVEVLIMNPSDKIEFPRVTKPQQASKQAPSNLLGGYYNINDLFNS